MILLDGNTAWCSICNKSKNIDNEIIIIENCEDFNHHMVLCIDCLSQLGYRKDIKKWNIENDKIK
jgi:uncharacterized protein YlaI